MSEGGAALVTGAGRGIGRAIALRLARDGRDVAVNDLEPEAASRTAGEIADLGGNVVALPGDVTDRDTVFGLAADAADEFGRLDVLVNNAGIVQVKPLVEVEPQELEQLFRVNVHAVLYGLQAGFEQMRERGGTIINAASIAGREGQANLGPYSATKFGVVGLTQAAAKEFAGHGITVNAYCPGIVGTDMWEFIDQRLGGYLGLGPGQARQRYASAALLDRVEEPAEVAGLVSYLASADAGFVTGQSVVVDGGIVLR
jgi:meso-butanediol dehydrogenase/(S,S)-butanediol dehydrogenase/diacetyl reductase